MDAKLQQIVTEAQAGGPRALRAAARLMTIMTDEPQRLAEMLSGSRDWPQPRLVLGVTGSPGSGKSTLVDHLAAEFRTRHPDRRLGIVAVDPSSPFTGGALLGDRVRMMRHATDPNVFIRSLASRGRLGGLALGAKGVVRVMGLIGCDIVIVETVGVGQTEVEIAQQADLTVVVLAPGQGDSIQMLKAGLIEAGDLFVVNKADREDAARLHQQLLGALRLSPRVLSPAGHGGAGGPKHYDAAACRDEVDRFPTERPVLLCSAVNHEGVADLAAELERLTAAHGDAWKARRQRQAIDEIRQALLQDIERRVDGLLTSGAAAEARLERVYTGEASIGQVAEELLREALHRSGALPPSTNGSAKAGHQPGPQRTNLSHPHEGMPR
jgi:LAO/AO transport system kinase